MKRRLEELKSKANDGNDDPAALGAYATELFMFTDDYDLAEKYFQKARSEARKRGLLDDVFRLYVIYQPINTHTHTHTQLQPISDTRVNMPRS